MRLDETWQVGLRPEKTKPCTFPAKLPYGFRRERKKMGRRGVVFFFVTWSTHHFCHFPSIDFRQRDRRTTCATFLRSISAKLSANTCPVGGSRHIPKKRLFRVQKGTLFVPSLWVTGNVLRHQDCFHPLVDIPQIYSSLVTFAERCTILQLSTPERFPLPQYQQWVKWQEAGH